MPRILILQHLEREGPGLFLDLASEYGINVFITRLDKGDSLPKLLKGDLLLILGGPMGIGDINNDQYPWLIKEIELIRYALRRQIGVLGICLGAQLLAYAAGGSIEPLKAGNSAKYLPEIGWSPIFLNPNIKNDAFAELLQTPLDVLHWHGDRIILPSHAELIACTRQCKEQLFRIGKLAYGIQFHLEIKDDMFVDWIEEDKIFIRKALGNEGQETLLLQQKKCAQSSLERRIDFLRKVFDIFGLK